LRSIRHGDSSSPWQPNHSVAEHTICEKRGWVIFGEQQRVTYPERRSRSSQALQTLAVARPHPPKWDYVNVSLGRPRANRF
ncbi:MAG: hypothetical protein LAP85_16160, partial [Acidobacteriia bacterium]|nr:hypothetical protein [Terriglobia bacterium]